MGNCCTGNQMLDRNNPQIILVTDQTKVDVAAKKIQAFFRGMRVRKEMKSLKNQYHCSNEHAPLATVAQLSRMPNYLTEKTKKVHDELGPFQEMWEEDLPRLGPYEYNDQTVYSGQYKNGLKHGYGVQMWVDGSVYEGQWQKNSAQGTGRLIHCGGDVYVGEWVHDKANGYVLIRELISMVMVRSMWDFGWMINNMVMELKHGQIILYLRGSITWVRSMVRENLSGRMVLNILGNLITIQFRVMGNIHGLMVENTQEHGRTIKWMVRGYLHGWMEESIKESIRMIKKRDMGNLDGQMEEFTKVSGRMVNNMEQECILVNRRWRSKEYGKKVKEYDGFIQESLSLLIEYQQQMNTIAQVLFLKVEQGNVNKVSEILQQYPNLIDIENPKSGQTCLTIACRKNDGPLIEKLINLGANVNRVNRLHQSPLWISSFYNYRRTADFLLSHGADVNQQDKKGFSPLMIAAQRGNLETIGLLLNAKANIQLLNKNQDTVFDLCKDYDTLQFMIQTLQIEEVRVKQPDKFKPKNTKSQSKNSNSHVREKSDSLPNLNEESCTVLSMINSICEEMQIIFSEAIQKFKETLINTVNLTEAKKSISLEYEKIQQSQSIEDNIQFQYDNFQYEISRQIGRTLYSILHHLDDSDQVKSPSPRNKKYLSAEPLIEASVEEEQSTPISQFRNQLTKVESPAQIQEPLGRSSVKEEQFNKMMTQKLEILNSMINSRIGNKKT